MKKYIFLIVFIELLACYKVPIAMKLYKMHSEFSLNKCAAKN